MLNCFISGIIEAIKLTVKFLEELVGLLVGERKILIGIGNESGLDWEVNPNVFFKRGRPIIPNRLPKDLKKGKHS